MSTVSMKTAFASLDAFDLFVSQGMTREQAMQRMLNVVVEGVEEGTLQAVKTALGVEDPQ